MKNILLVQFRSDISASHERGCFLKFFQKRKNLNLKIINIFDKKANFSPEILNQVQGVILSGSGELYLSKIEQEKILQLTVKKISSFVKNLLRNDFPTLGICFGYQLLGYFLGEKIVRDESRAQTGTFLVSLTKEGLSCPIFKKIPRKFFAQFGYKEVLENLPKGTKLLGSTKKCKTAAFQYRNNIFGVQFHPELNFREMYFRLKLYPDYLRNQKKISKNLKASPFASKIIENFLIYTYHSKASNLSQVNNLSQLKEN